jgi:hypothetical protein
MTRYPSNVRQRLYRGPEPRPENQSEQSSINQAQQA